MLLLQAHGSDRPDPVSSSAQTAPTFFSSGASLQSFLQRRPRRFLAQTAPTFFSSRAPGLGTRKTNFQPSRVSGSAPRGGSSGLTSNFFDFLSSLRGRSPSLVLLQFQAQWNTQQVDLSFRIDCLHPFSFFYGESSPRLGMPFLPLVQLAHLSLLAA